MRRTKKVEIWATFEKDGKIIDRHIETCRNIEAANSAIDVMNHHNQYELGIGYGFPSGVPTYYIMPYGTAAKVGQIVRH